MKKIVAIASIFALAACGGSDVEADAEGEVVDEAASVIPDSAGTYVFTNEEGQVYRAVLNEDGTYEDTLDGEVVETGTWEDNIRGTCFTADVAEGEEAGGEECFNVGPVQEDGTVQITDPNGETTTATKEA